MIRSTLFILVTLVAILQADDTDTKYYKCAETNFCNNLRGKDPSDKLVPGNLPAKASNQDSATLDFKSTNYPNCKLNIQLLKNNLVRVILDVGKSRYKIPDGIVLEKDQQETIK
nr:unnamed protein product [Callosobruchus analis]